MRTTIALLTVILATSVLSPASADVQSDERGWHCGGPEEWDLLSLRVAPNLVLNNFFFEEGDSFSTDMRVLKVEYSATNRATNRHRMTAQFAGFSADGALTFAVSASPPFDAVKPGTVTVSGDAYVVEAVLPGTTRICAYFASEEE